LQKGFLLTKETLMEVETIDKLGIVADDKIINSGNISLNKI
jgi:hypothetical protein